MPLSRYIFLLFLPLLVVVSPLASASDLEVTSAWARASAGSGKSGAAYVTIVNHGPADRLIGVSTERARKAELHTHMMDNGVMRMRPADGVDVPMRGAVELAPGGDHIMLMGLDAPLREGENFMATLIFEKAGNIDVKVEVAGVAAQSGATGAR